MPLQKGTRSCRACNGLLHKWGSGKKPNIIYTSTNFWIGKRQSRFVSFARKRQIGDVSIALLARHIVQNVAAPHTAETLSTELNGGLVSFMNKAGSGKWDRLSTSVIMVIGAHKPPKTLMTTLTLTRRDRVHNGGQVMTIVHTSGVHYLPVVFCGCSQAAAEDIQLFWVGLYPSTYKSCKTVFTFQLLDDYLLENLECKTLATHYYSCYLHRLQAVAGNQYWYRIFL